MTMTVNKELSVVADSTCSPCSSSPTLKQRAPPYDGSKMSDDTDTSPIYPPSSSASRDITYRTGPPDLDEQVPPSSDLFHSFSDNELADDENEDSPKDALGGDFFGWRKWLREYDKQDNSDVALPAISGTHNASPSGRPLATQLSSPLTVSSLPQTAFTVGPSPLSPQIIQARRRLKKRVVHDSNSESEPADDKRSPATRSPVFLHAISTPKSRSSPTPPTSDEDKMPAHPMQGYNSKGKGKVDPASLRPTVLPLRFSEDLNDLTVVQKKAAHKDKRKKKIRIKPPTKKELNETRRDSARLAADQPVSIPRNEDNIQKYTIQQFFTTVITAGRPIGKEPSSDPIAEFSSPSKDSLTSINHYAAPSSTSTLHGDASPLPAPRTRPGSSLFEPMALLGDFDSDSNALPEAGELVSEEQKKQDRAHIQKSLLEKKKLLMAQQATNPVESDDDDDLEIMPAREMQAVVKEEEAERKSGKKKGISEGRKRQLRLGGVGIERRRAKPTSPMDKALPFVVSSVGKLKVKKDSVNMTQDELNKTLVQRVVSVNRELTKKKEAEWVRRGGKVIDGGECVSSANSASATYAEKGLQAAEEQGNAMELDVDEDEGSDEEWASEMRGSASPFPQSDDGEPGDQENQTIEEEPEADTTMVNPESDVLAMDDDSDEKQVRTRARHHVQAIVDSESDGGNDENPFLIPKPTQRTFGSPQDHNNEDPPLTMSIPLMSHRGSLSSTDERTEDENDKENNTSLMFDRSEDKENKAVVRHGDIDTKHLQTVPPFGLEHDVARGLSMSSMFQSRGIDADDDNEDGRRPLKDLLDDDPFASQVGSSNQSTSFAVRLQQASPIAVPPVASLPTFMGKGGGYSQSLQQPSIFGGEPLQPGFSELFESGTEKQTTVLFKGVLALSESFSDEPESTSNKLRKPGHSESALDLTQDIALQPAFQIGSGLLRKADQIFEKEQGYLLEATSKKLQKGPTLYVNDHGFLTQNRPDAASPRIYIPLSPSQPSTLIGGLDSQSSERRPLRTLSLSQSIDLDSPDAPLRRLRRAVSTPSHVADVDYRSSPSLSPSPRKRLPNAFEAMAGAAKAKGGNVKRRLEKSEFIEAEARESDDDEMFGFKRRQKDDGEEEDGEDLDKTLETLVDDQEMDEETVNALLVQEKYQEHADQDDRDIEKLHQAAIQGELRRKKRNHGVSMDDSDDESDDDEKNRRIRRGMYKKPRIDRDNIKDLANLDETKPFYQVYEHGLINDAEFAFLEQSQDSRDIVMDDGDQEDDGRAYDSVTPAEIQRLARELVEQAEDEEPVDLSDVSWIDLDPSDGEGSVRFKPVDVHPRKQTRPQRRGIDDIDFDSSLDVPRSLTLPEKIKASMQSWAKTEVTSRNAGSTGRSVGGAAVTGHARAKVKAGGGSLRNSSTANPAPTDSSWASESERRAMKPIPSLLAGVAADRTMRFG